MGRDLVHFSIYGAVSRHNSDQDRRDDAAWERLQQEVGSLIDSDPEYCRLVYFQENPLGRRSPVEQAPLPTYRRN